MVTDELCGELASLLSADATATPEQLADQLALADRIAALTARRRWLLLGKVALARGSVAEAVRVLEDARAAYPEDSEILSAVKYARAVLRCDSLPPQRRYGRRRGGKNAEALASI